MRTVICLYHVQNMSSVANSFAVCASFQIDIQNFEQNQQVLLMGRTRRLARDNKTDIDSLSNIAGVTMLNTVSDSWSLTKSKLMELIDMTEVPESTLKEYMDLVDETAAATEHFLESVSTVTRTTTLMVVDILSPVPMTGHWHTILDDQCEGRRGANVVVSAMVSKGNYVGLTGMGCDGVCQQVSTLSSSFQLPFLSFNCPSQEFSNEVEFPSLLRMGTPTGTNQMEEIMLKLKEKHGWQTVFLVSGDPGVYSSEVERYAELFQRIGVQTQHLSALESRMADILTVMRTIKAQTQDSGLGRAFREVLANPDAVSYAPPEAYGACDGCLASFLATGIRDSLNRLIGVYAIQLPETYEKSIEDEEAFKDVCTLEAIAEAHEGEDPYDDVKALALDGACAYAFAVQNMLKTGYSIQQLQQPEAETHERLTFFLRNELEFQGVSGRVKFDGNTRKNPLVVQQVQHGRRLDPRATGAKEVALVDINGNFIWLSDNGTMSDAWMIEPVPEFQETENRLERDVGRSSKYHLGCHHCAHVPWGLPRLEDGAQEADARRPWRTRKPSLRFCRASFPEMHWK
eukprot:g1594.t1